MGSGVSLLDATNTKILISHDILKKIFVRQPNFLLSVAEQGQKVNKGDVIAFLL